MKVKVVDLKGKKIRDVELQDEVFGLKPNKSSIYEAIKNELANARQGTSSTKTKAEVSGSGKKPWKQKGTGRASFGTTRNPVWVHGGIAFGPKPRDYSYQIPKKIKRMAYRSILSLKNQSENLVILDELFVETLKTKDFLKKFDEIIKNNKVCVVVEGNEKDILLRKAVRNIPSVKVLNYNMLKSHTLYYSEKILMSENVAKLLNDFLKND